MPANWNSGRRSILLEIQQNLHAVCPSCFCGIALFTPIIPTFIFINISLIICNYSAEVMPGLVKRSRWVGFSFNYLLTHFFSFFVWHFVWQLNANTHYLDLSLVYGSDDKTAGELRTMENGKLNVTSRKDKGPNERDLLPPSADNVSALNAPCTLAKEVSGIDPPEEVKCFKAGERHLRQIKREKHF